MATTTFTIKQNDRIPVMVAQLTTGSGASIDLTGATSVKFLMRPLGSQTVKVNAACTITSAGTGVVQYAWAAGDTDTIGVFQGEFQITWPGPKYQTVPNGDYIGIIVVDDIAD